jgi:hypothetical protein
VIEQGGQWMGSAHGTAQVAQVAQAAQAAQVAQVAQAVVTLAQSCSSSLYYKPIMQSLTWLTRLSFSSTLDDDTQGARFRSWGLLRDSSGNHLRSARAT